MMYLHVRGFKMAYTDFGRGIPLLFIHGYPLNRQLWKPQVRDLVNVARVLAPDLRGHGDSQAVPGPYSMELFADDLNALLLALEIYHPVVLCGLSMGGYIAFAFYRKYAERVAGLILTATRATADTPEGKAARDQAAELARRRGVSAVVETMLPKLLSPKTYAQRPDLVARCKAIMERTSLRGVLGDLAALKERPDSTPMLSQIQVPTLIIYGADDAIIPPQEVRAMQAAIPEARLEIVPEAGHLPNLEKPDAFNRLVRDFLKTV